MSGVNGQFGAPPPPVTHFWQELRASDGRAYYYNSSTKVTQWTKPEELMTMLERALNESNWKEYTTEGGRKYWYNTETATSSWEMPEEFRALQAPAVTPTTPAAPVAIPTAPAAFHTTLEQRDGPIPESRQLSYGGNDQPQRTGLMPSGYEVESATTEEAEAAFVKVLRRCGVQPDWPWIKAMEVIVKDPHSRMLRDPLARRAIFERYCQDVVSQDKERARERLSKLRADFATMLRSHPEIKYYTRWRTARPILEGETIFRSTSDEDERRRLFDEYISDLRRTHREQRAAARKSAMDSLVELLPQLKLTSYTRWADALPIIEATPLFQTTLRMLRSDAGGAINTDEDELPPISRFDVLTAFQNHIKSLERAENDARQRDKMARQRVERKNREAFVALLADLRKDGKIKAGTKWSQIYPLIEHDERYTNMVGQSGSTPQDLFWDLVEEEQSAIRALRNNVEDVCLEKRFEIAPATSFDTFLGVMKADRRTAGIDVDVLELIYEQLRTKKKEQRDDEDRHAERLQRRALDDLRALLKRLQPPLTASDTFDKVKSRLLKTEEFQAVASEEARQSAIEKYIRRLREKEEDAERDRQRRRDRDDRSSYRDRDRGERSIRGSRPGRSRSPEADNYEADRRRAIAERERNHRPGVEDDRLEGRERDRHDKDRDRRDRYRDNDHPVRRRDESHYDRERRDREEERERQYRRRVADRNPDELNYGDEKPPSVRRRREEDGRRESRDSKRVKRESSCERTPHRQEGPATSTLAASGPGTGTTLTVPTGAATATTARNEDPGGVHSGSEEGEIEED